MLAHVQLMYTSLKAYIACTLQYQNTTPAFAPRSWSMMLTVVAQTGDYTKCAMTKAAFYCTEKGENQSMRQSEGTLYEGHGYT